MEWAMHRAQRVVHGQGIVRCDPCTAEFPFNFTI